MNKMLEAALEVEKAIIRDRRHIHEMPEVGFDLPKTAAYIKMRLGEMGVKYRDCGGVLQDSIRKKFRDAGFPDMKNSTGVVAVIGSGEPCILLRADMDGLPMAETSGLDFASKTQAAHTCGHDAHTAMLLGAAQILKKRESELKGTVKLMFQPGEELGYGAKTMIEDGLLENPKVDAALAIHVMADRKSGTVEFVKGAASAAMDTYMLTIKGKGGHSSMPHQAIDPNMIMNQLYTSLNLLVTREVDPKEVVALTVGKLSGGSAANIIPDTAEMQIGMRTFNPVVQKHMSARVEEMIEHIVSAWRGRYEYQKFFTPTTVNSAAFVDQVRSYIIEIAGEDEVHEASGPMSGSEDFGYVTDAVPGLFLILGAGDAGAYPMHNPNMVLDERVFAKGAAMYANVAMGWLRDNCR